MAAGGKGPPIGGERHGIDLSSVPWQSEKFLAGEHIPDSDDPTRAGGCQVASIGRKGQREKLFMIAVDRRKSGAGPLVPKNKGLPRNLWVPNQRTGSAPVRQEGSPSRLHHHLAPVG